MGLEGHHAAVHDHYPGEEPQVRRVKGSHHLGPSYATEEKYQRSAQYKNAQYAEDAATKPGHHLSSPSVSPDEATVRFVSDLSARSRVTFTCETGFNCFRVERMRDTAVTVLSTASRHKLT